jgi:hypothetical protein
LLDLPCRVVLCQRVRCHRVVRCWDILFERRRVVRVLCGRDVPGFFGGLELRELFCRLLCSRELGIMHFLFFGDILGAKIKRLHQMWGRHLSRHECRDELRSVRLGKLLSIWSSHLHELCGRDVPIEHGFLGMHQLPCRILFTCRCKFLYELRCRHVPVVHGLNELRRLWCGHVHVSCGLDRVVDVQ